MNIIVLNHVDKGEGGETEAGTCDGREPSTIICRKDQACINICMPYHCEVVEDIHLVRSTTDERCVFFSLSLSDCIWSCLLMVNAGEAMKAKKSKKMPGKFLSTNGHDDALGLLFFTGVFRPWSLVHSVSIASYHSVRIMNAILLMEALSIDSEVIDRFVILVSAVVGRVASLVFNLYDC